MVVFLNDGLGGFSPTTLTSPNPEDGGSFGFSLTTGDVDGDLDKDLIVGAPDEDGLATFDSGRVYIFDNPTLTLLATIEDTTSRRQTQQSFGDAVAAGDFRAVGVDDLLIGVPDWEDDRPGLSYGRGRVVFVFSPLSGPVYKDFLPPWGGGDVGFAVAAGRLDDDAAGKDDALIGAPFAKPSNQGQVPTEGEVFAILNPETDPAVEFSDLRYLFGAQIDALPKEATDFGFSVATGKVENSHICGPGSGWIVGEPFGGEDICPAREGRVVTGQID